METVQDHSGKGILGKLSADFYLRLRKGVHILEVLGLSSSREIARQIYDPGAWNSYLSTTASVLELHHLVFS